MDRRKFLSSCSGAVAGTLLPRWSWAAELPRDLKITRIVGFALESQRPKICGKNSRLGVHGDRARDSMVRIYTDAGIESLGSCRADEKAAASLLGQNPFTYFRQYAGPDILLAVDANNGYDLARTKRFLTDLPDVNLAFLEEMFNEQVNLYLDLKAFMAEHKLKTRIADGETQSELEAYKPFIASRTIDILEGDINVFGIK